jgi:hypothetical protein
MSDDPRDNPAAGDPPIERWVAAWLERSASPESCQRVEDQVLGRLHGRRCAPSAQQASPWSTRVAWLTTVAALIAIAFSLGRWENPAFGGASGLVRVAKSVHGMAMERCYVVKTERVTGSLTPPERSQDLGSWPEVKVWTQGNRFWVEVHHARGSWAWGRDRQGAVWLTLGRHRGLQIEPAEIGDFLQKLCDLHSLELPALLETFHQRWVLSSQSRTATSHVIVARPRYPDPRRIHEAILEVDRETKAIRQLTLIREPRDREQLRVTFTLVDTRLPEEHLYQPYGHLEKPFEILSKDHLALERGEVLKSWFSIPPERWIVGKGTPSAAATSSKESLP